jgi:hypothetical protein
MFLGAFRGRPYTKDPGTGKVEGTVAGYDFYRLAEIESRG